MIVRYFLPTALILAGVAAIYGGLWPLFRLWMGFHPLFACPPVPPVF
jgi:hypothetical protein